MFLLCCEFQIITLKTWRRCRYTNPTRTNFLSKIRVRNSINNDLKRVLWLGFDLGFCNLYAHAQPISLLWCKSQTITLKTVGVVVELGTVLYSVTNGHSDVWQRVKLYVLFHFVASIKSHVALFLSHLTCEKPHQGVFPKILVNLRNLVDVPSLLHERQLLWLLFAFLHTKRPIVLDKALFQPKGINIFLISSTKHRLWYS